MSGQPAHVVGLGADAEHVGQRESSTTAAGQQSDQERGSDRKHDQNVPPGTRGTGDAGLHCIEQRAVHDALHSSGEWMDSYGYALLADE
jgi:hypothetical protein